jgi:hypothetical protein
MHTERLYLVPVRHKSVYGYTSAGVILGTRVEFQAPAVLFPERLGGSQSRYGRCLALAGNRIKVSRMSTPQPSRYTDYALPPLDIYYPRKTSKEVSTNFGNFPS